jgi:hypothetical protein
MDASPRTTPFRVSSDRTDEPFAHPKCYARCLQTCSRKISGEHYFTHAILRKIGLDPRGIYLRGAPWQPDGVWIPPHALTAAVLCDRHNSQLSPLDEFASSLDDELIEIHRAAQANQVVSTLARFYGPNLERWLMKSLCGFAAARPGVFGSSDAHSPVPGDWVRYLFGEIDLDNPAGIYLSSRAGESRAVDPNGLTFTSLHARGELSGLMVDMRFLRFTFISIAWDGTIRGAIDDASIRRPWRIRIAAGASIRRLDFDWPEGSGPEARFRLDVGAGAA